MKRKTDNFNKFFQKKSNAAIKEEFRQEKKAIKKERREAIEKHFEEKRRLKYKADEPEAGQKSKSRPPSKDAGKPFKTSIKASGRSGIAEKPGKPVTAHPLLKPAKTAPSTALPQGKIPVPSKEPKPALSKAQKPVASPGQKLTASQKPGAATKQVSADNTIPLNKYIAHGGICSRRDAADLIRQGNVTVNGKNVTEPGTKVTPDDLVKVNGKKVVISHNLVYILLNKPKDYITTTDDPQGRKTVLDLIRQATTERVYPVGRLDRNTSGVLLLTNDGELAQKLAHPKHEIRKIYHVVLDKALTKADFDKIAAGVALEDGVAIVDAVAYTDTKDRTQIGLEIHSGRNRIVRRIFEHLGYDVKGLDRVMYATLTKKNVQRGKWRLLSEKEIRILKYLNSSSK